MLSMKFRKRVPLFLLNDGKQKLGKGNFDLKAISEVINYDR